MNDLQSSGPPVRLVREIRGLSPAEVAESPQIKIRGVVVYHEPQGHRTFVCDETESIYVHVKPHDAKLTQLEVGMLVEVEGVIAPGAFNRCIEGAGNCSAAISILGQSPLPPGRKVTLAEMAEPSQDSSWIEISGIVRGVSLAASRARLNLEINGQNFQALVAQPEPACAETLPWHLVEQKVRLRAVLACIFNRDRQMTGRLLLVPSIREVIVEEPPVASHQTLPLRSLNSLLQSDAPEAFGPVRVEGIVTAALPGQGLFLRGANVGCWVETVQPITVVVGSIVEVIGFPALACFRPTLRAVKVRELRRDGPPTPFSVTISDLFSGVHHAALVCVEGTVIKVQISADQAILYFHASVHLFQARLDGRLERSTVKALVPGGKVQVTGICLSKPSRNTHALQVVDGFEILLRNSADVVVTATPSLHTSERAFILVGIICAVFTAILFLGGVWTAGRILFVLGLLAIGALVCLAWIGLLRRRVAVLTTRIQQEAIHDERLRIARDLHDDLGARVTHLGALAALGGEDAADVASARSRFATIRDGAREIVQALDAAVWTVNPENDSIADLATYLCQWAGDFFHPTLIRCRFDVDGALPKRSVPITVRNELFLAVKESLNNVARHSGANEVWLRVTAQEGPLKITVEDNGQGLPESTSNGFGLKNIRERLERIAGTLMIRHRADGGTVLVFSIPLR